MKYNEIVSLGYNCEVSNRIADYWNELDSFVYSWAYSYDRDKLIESLTHLDEILTGDAVLVPWGMFKDIRFNMTFHPTMELSLFNSDGSENKEHSNIVLEDTRRRIKHLSRKFYDLLSKEKKNTLFIYKIKSQDFESDCMFIKQLNDTLSSLYITGQFTLLIVFDKEHFKTDLLRLESESLKIRYIDSFADDGMTDVDGDIKGWKKIFYEFDKCTGEAYERNVQARVEDRNKNKA